MRESDWAWELAEAIRMVLINAHYERCECAKNLHNGCNRKRLEAAFKRYTDAHPELFPIF